MAAYGAIALSFLVTLGFFLYDRKAYTWWEFFMAPIATTVIVLLTQLIFKASSSYYGETWGSTVVAVYEEAPYNYWHNETCSRQVACGTDKDGNTEYCTEYYDCSHQDDVGPSWWATTNIGENISISEGYFEKLTKQFGSLKVVDSQRENYDADDECVGSRGTKFEDKAVGNYSYVLRSDWKRTDATRQPVASEHNYKNKVKASNVSVFNIKVVTPEDVKRYGLYDYPKMQNNPFTYPTILGGGVSEKTQENFRKLNGKFGPTNEVRIWVLVFENKPEVVGNYQENYWVRGNMNEVVICIGKNGSKIQWTNVFSWGTNEKLRIDIRNYINTIPTLNEKGWSDLYVYLNTNMGKFKRRDFKEFDYLTRESSKGELWTLYILGILAAIGVNIWTSRNEFTDDDPTGGGYGSGSTAGYYDPSQRTRSNPFNFFKNSSRY